MPAAGRASSPADAMQTYLRLLGYLKPYRVRFALALGCMVTYALMSAIALGLISPFMQVLFERVGDDQVRTLALPGHASTERTLELAREPLRIERPTRWPGILRARAERSLVLARPLVALQRICLFILVVLLLKNLADYLQAFLMVSVEQAAIRDLRAALLAQLQRLSLSFYHSRRTGSLIARVTNDVEYL